MTSKLITTTINWRDAKTCLPPVSGYYVVICGFEDNDGEMVPNYTTVLLYSNKHNMFNVQDTDVTTDNAIKSVMYWCYTNELFNQLKQEEKDNV